MYTKQSKNFLGGFLVEKELEEVTVGHKVNMS